MKCPNCGAQNRSGAKFCIECGTDLSMLPQQGNRPALQKWLAIGPAVILIIAVGLAAFLIGSRHGGGEPTPESGTGIPAATATQSARPVPVTPSPTPDTRIFWDDFETGIKPDWNMEGDNFNAVDGKLVSSGKVQSSVGDYTWVDYKVVFTGYSFSNLGLKFRVQDENNYMEMLCYDRGCNWNKVSGGQSKGVPGVGHYLPRKPAIEMEGNVYRIIDLESGDTLVTFVDDTVSFGGVILTGYNLNLDEFEVYPLP